MKNRQSVYKGEDQMEKRFLCRICLPLLVWFAFAGLWRSGAQKAPPPILAGESVIVCGSVYRQEFRNERQSIYLKNISILSDMAEFLPENAEIQQNTEHNSFFKGARLLLYVKEPCELHIGETVLASGEINYPRKERNPGGFDAESYYGAQKIVGFLRKAVILKTDGKRELLMDSLYQARRFLCERIYKSVPEKDAGILCAMLLGDRGGLDAGVKSLYQDNGIIHILAISGLHISMIGMALYHLLRKIRLRHWLAGLFAAVLMLGYGVMTGFAYSALRAVTMFLAFLLAQATGRTYDLPTALALSATGILLFQNAAVTQAGFLLSFAAVGGVLLTKTWNVKLLKGTALGVSLSVYLTTIPLIAWYYYQLPLYGIFLNLLVVPLVPFIVGFTAAGLIAGEMVMYPAHILLTVLEQICEKVRLLPFASIVVRKPQLWQLLLYYVLLLAVLFFLQKAAFYRKSLKMDLIKLSIAIILVISIFFFPQRKPFTITFLDVGQGDGCCIENASGSVYLVDGGSSSEKNLAQYTLEPFLMSKGIDTVDCWMVSHYDADHISGLLEILEGYVPGLLGNNAAGITIGTIVLPIREEISEQQQKICELAQKNGIFVRFVQKGDILRENELTIRILSPQTGAAYENENAASMVAAVSYQGFRALLTGDVEGEAENALLSNGQEKENLRADVLKAAHHGSRGSSSAAFLECARPEIICVSSGEDNRYGHPHTEFLERAAKTGSRIVRTDVCGAVTVTVKDGKYRVQTYLQEPVA